MKSFIHPDFLLDTPQACELYHGFAEPCPIVDYHCHLSPAEIAENRPFANITQAWLGGDHYKWRAMRTVGVPEELITGSADDHAKFLAWAATVPKMLRNPLYHWTHLELARVFGIDDTLLCPETAEEVWQRANAVLAAPGMGARDILAKLGVELVCTTDDPDDTLAEHQAQNDRGERLRMLPTWRPGRHLALKDVSLPFEEMLEHLRARHDVFHAAGCRLSDYSVESFAAPATEAEACATYEAVRAGREPSTAARDAFAAWLLLFLGRLDAASGWTRQLHIGALRNPNAAMFAKLGPDTGFDAIADFPYAEPLARHLSVLAAEGALPCTILYNLNPKDTHMLAVLCGSFQDGTPGGRVNLGPAWWFLDQMDGMEENLKAISALGCLHQFPGMLTDSRSVLSVPRHEYFRRILCRMLGRDLRDGLLPNDLPSVGAMVRAIAYGNARALFA